jgi:hypothetical protein
MPSATLTTDLSGLGLDRLLAAISAGADDGLDKGAALLEQTDRDTDAYYGQSGATRESTFATRIGPNKDSSAEAHQAYTTAAQLLSGFTGHAGNPFVGDSGITLKDGERGIILSNGTDYAEALEIDGGGQKAHLGPSLQATADQITALAAQGIAGALS